MKDTPENVLLFALSNGMINESVIELAKEEMEKRELEKYLSLHPYSIFQNTDGYWQTYLPDKVRKRKAIRRRKLDDLHMEIVSFWKKENGEEDTITIDTTLRELYYFWIEHKMKRTQSSTSIKRLENDWKKYYLPETDFIDSPIFKKKKTELEDWTYEMIQKHHMTKQQYYNMSTIIRQALQYVADEDEDWTFYNINKFKRFTIPPNTFFPPKEVISENEVYSKEECILLKKAIEEMIEEKPNNTLLYAMKLWFYLGLRVGELCALKFSDFDFKAGYVTIHRQLTADYNLADVTSFKKNGDSIKNHAKCHKTRKISLAHGVEALIEQIKVANLNNGENNDGFVFPRNGSYNHKQNFERTIKRCCKRAGIPYKSGHKIRKTVESSLIESGMNPKVVSEMMGHDLSTEFHSYFFTRKQSSELRDEVSKSLPFNT